MEQYAAQYSRRWPAKVGNDQSLPLWSMSSAFLTGRSAVETQKRRPQLGGVWIRCAEVYSETLHGISYFFNSCSSGRAGPACAGEVAKPAWSNAVPPARDCR